MQGTRYSEEQIVRIPGEVEGGRSVAEASRQVGVSEGTLRLSRAFETRPGSGLGVACVAV